MTPTCTACGCLRPDDDRDRCDICGIDGCTGCIDALTGLCGLCTDIDKERHT